MLGLGDALNRGDGPGEMGAALPAVDLGTGLAPVAVAAGWFHNCAMLQPGSVIKCWGCVLGRGGSTPIDARSMAHQPA